MRTFLSALLPLVLSVGFANTQATALDLFCDSSCDCDSIGCDSMCSDGFFDGLGIFQDCGITVDGWINAGFIGNTASPTSKFNGPYNAVDRSNEAMLNQIYLIAEKALPRCGFGVGGRLDYLYGEDFLLAQSTGIEERPDDTARWNKQYYGSAIPQAFVSFGNESLSLQVGHFYSVVGYEGVMAPDNFFYSKSYSYQFAGPFTHWGGQLNWQASEALSVQLGLHNGWDAFDRVSDKIGFIGKVRYDSHSTGRWTSFAITTGEESNNLAGLAPTPDFTNRTRYSWLVGLPLTCKLDYVFHHWLGLQERGAADGGQADWYGIDQYLTYTVNPCTKVAMRFEWFRDEEGTRVGLNRTRNGNNPPFPGNFYSLSLGVNYSPADYLMFRPEIRADWFEGPNAFQPFDDGTDDNQLMLGFDVIVRL